MGFLLLPYLRPSSDSRHSPYGWSKNTLCSGCQLELTPSNESVRPKANSFGPWYLLDYRIVAARRNNTTWRSTCWHSHQCYLWRQIILNSTPRQYSFYSARSQWRRGLWLNCLGPCWTLQVTTGCRSVLYVGGSCVRGEVFCGSTYCLEGWDWGRKKTVDTPANIVYVHMCLGMEQESE